jgi:capsule polysaccharide export protein KpsE/RkpR
MRLRRSRQDRFVNYGFFISIENIERSFFMRNFCKIFWIIVFGVIIGFSISAQSNDVYVTVFYARSSGSDSYTFSNNNFGLTTTATSTAHGIATILNYMDRNGYSFIQLEHLGTATYMIVFRKK